MSPGDGTINYLIFSSCLPGMSDKLVAIPVWDFDTTQRFATVTVSVTKDQFLGAPAISSMEWNNLGSRWTSWLEEEHASFEKAY